MSKRGMEKTFAYVETIQKAGTPAAIRDIILTYIGAFGATNFVLGLVPISGIMFGDLQRYILLNAYPDPWVEHYFRGGFIQHDPTVRLIRAGWEAFLWSEIDRSYLVSTSARRVMGEAGEYGMREGLTVALPTLDQQMVAFSIAGERLSLGVADRGRIAFLAQCAVMRLALLRQAARPLTEREHQALLWKSEGFTDDALAARMNISRQGAEWLLRQVRDKLGVERTNEAIREGFRLGLLS